MELEMVTVPQPIPKKRGRSGGSKNKTFAAKTGPMKVKGPPKKCKVHKKKKAGVDKGLQLFSFFNDSGNSNPTGKKIVLA